jgi:hypothetical protein
MSVLRRMVLVVAWMTAAVVAVFVSWVSALIVANLTGIGETAPGVAANAVAAGLDEAAIARIDEGAFCGFPCLVNVVPDGPAYEGSAVLRLTDVSGEQIAEALTAAGFEPGDAGLDIPAFQRLKLEGDLGGVPVVWHARDLAGSRGVVVQVTGVGAGSPSLYFDEAYPPALVRWAAPATGLAVVAGCAWTATWFRHRRRRTPNPEP